MIKQTITMFDKGYQTHWTDIEPDEKPLVYCMAYTYPLGSASNAEYWFLITDKKFRLARRKNTLMGLIESNDNVTIDVKDICAKDEKTTFKYRIQFYNANDIPQKAHSPISIHGAGAIGGALEAIINGTHPPMILFHFKADDYEEIKECFKKLGQLAE